MCLCKQGVATACEAVRVVNPKLANALEKEAARRAAEEAAARAAKQILEQAAAMESVVQAVEPQEASRQQAEEVADSEARTSSGAPEPPDCKGQLHHIISRPIAKALEEHRTLRGLYKPRDERFITRGKDEKAHCG
ncbi:MAG TPA: hypothetical protein VLQ93_13730, partial [Myxococcaceae bacterium]|nr:hypothetical protein [Myxococcaceae bacterium]